MKQRLLTSGAVVLTVLLAVASKFLPLHIGDYIFDLFILTIMLLASIEMSNIMENTKKRNNRFLSLIYPIFFYIVLLISLNLFITATGYISLLYVLLAEFLSLFIYFVIILITVAIMNRKDGFKTNLNIAYNTILTCIYPSFIIGLILIINHMDFFAGVDGYSVPFIVMVFAITWLTDSLAFLIGCSIKGPKLCPKISPNKTISGAIGGLIGGIIGAMIVYCLMYFIPNWNVVLNTFNMTWWHFLIIGLVGSVLCQCGDLFESKLKRNANMKDSGNILPGHGGILDRIDAMIFCIIVIYIVSLVIII